MDSLNRFNWIASGYDRLAAMIYGKTLYESQVCFLSSIQQGCNVLVIGGGSGAVLKKLFSVNPTAHVWFIEASSRMIELASQELSIAERQQTRFIHGTEESIPEGVSFDAIITHFFLDLFPDVQLQYVCKQLSGRLRAEGLWLASDFVDTRNSSQRLLLWVMYRFFRITCKIQAERLPAWEYAISSADVKQTRFHTFFSGFIKSTVYKKRGDACASSTRQKLKGPADR